MNWLTTILIFLPVAGALLIWILPLQPFAVGSTALLIALAEVGVWIESVARFDFGQAGPQLDQRTSWFSDLHVSDLVSSGTSGSDWIFLGFAAAFAVKAPLFPLHGWLPEAYRESSPEVAAVLSGVVSKAAAYGFLRIAISKFPGPTSDFRIPILVLAACGLLYGSVLAFRAPDLRGVIAYSSLAQLGLITLGLFAVNDLGLNGAVLQMVNHGLISATLFMLAGSIERRAATGELARLGGMARGRPALATLLITTRIIALPGPGSSGFAGEVLILAG